LKFAFIQQQKVAFPVAALCRLLGVSTSGFYASEKRKDSRHSRRDAELARHIHALHVASGHNYGSPRILEDLKALGQKVGRKRVARLMRQTGLKALVRRRFKATTDSKHTHPIAPNLLDRDFTAEAPNRVWVTDITYLHTTQGWLYLAVILDLFSRRIVGWATSQTIDCKLALAALEMAIQERKPQEGLVHHSDRGSTYTADAYRQALRDGAIECSMSRKGDCWDNAVAESFFATLKREMHNADSIETAATGTLSAKQFIETYNYRRRHSSINYRTPVEFELLHSLKKRSA
jgi:transposase InsO family protein